MTRAAQVVFAVLVLAAFGAFFAAQELKTSPSVVQRFMLKYPVISPNGDGRLDRQRVTFRLKRADTVDVAIVDDRGEAVRRHVRTCVDERCAPRGEHRGSRQEPPAALLTELAHRQIDEGRMPSRP